MGDELKKVRPGEPLRIPAGAYNAFIDAARAQQEGRQLFARRPAAHAAQAGVAIALNASGQAAPRYGVVELAPRTLSEAQIEFVMPGAESGAGVYAVLLEPVPAGGLGLIALSGGPHTVLVGGDAVSCGDEVGPQNDSWAAALDGTPAMWVAAADEADDAVRAMFLAGGGGAVLLAQADADMIADETEYTVILLTVAGASAGVTHVYRPPGIAVKKYEVGVLVQDAVGVAVFMPMRITIVAGTHMAKAEAVSDGQLRVTLSESGTRDDGTQHLRVEVEGGAAVGDEGRIYLHK